jgi:molecular chaperone HscB
VLNYFSLLDMPAAVDLDRTLLDLQYREQQLRWHPDRFAAAPAAERQQALQRASLLNDAYLVLKTPLRRAEHLVELLADGCTHNVRLPIDFLEQQLTARESLESAAGARDRQAVEALRRTAETAASERWSRLRQQITEQDLRSAQISLQELQFLHKFVEEVERLEERWLDS